MSRVSAVLFCRTPPVCQRTMCAEPNAPRRNTGQGTLPSCTLICSCMHALIQGPIQSSLCCFIRSCVHWFVHSTEHKCWVMCWARCRWGRQRGQPRRSSPTCPAAASGSRRPPSLWPPAMHAQEVSDHQQGPRTLLAPQQYAWQYMQLCPQRCKSGSEHLIAAQ